MNRRFVNVKVDREERPDVDAVYMDAVQAMTGRGGWPMTVFMTADGDPFYGGTYFPKPNFLQLHGGHRRRLDEPPRRGRPRTATPCARPSPARPTCSPATDLPDVGHLNRTVQALAANFDREWGGFGAAPKFPSTMSLDLVLSAHLRSGDPAAREIVDDVARRDGVGRDVRPHRRRLRPLLGRPRVARAALREDALRPGAARARLRPRRGRPRRARGGARSSPRPSATCCATCARTAAGSRRPRTPTRPGPTGTATRACSTRGRSTRCAPCSAPTPTPPSPTTASPPTGNFEGRSIPNRLHARGSFERPRRASRTPGDACSRPASSGRAPVSTTRCSPSGTR